MPLLYALNRSGSQCLDDPRPPTLKLPRIWNMYALYILKYFYTCSMYASFVPRQMLQRQHRSFRILLNIISCNPNLRHKKFCLPHNSVTKAHDGKSKAERSEVMVMWPRQPQDSVTVANSFERVVLIKDFNSPHMRHSWKHALRGRGSWLFTRWRRLFVHSFIFEVIT